MAICVTCNGWGVVYTLKQLPPATTNERVRQRVIFMDPKKCPELARYVHETVCLSCGGYGTRVTT